MYKLLIILSILTIGVSLLLTIMIAKNHRQEDDKIKITRRYSNLLWYYIISILVGLIGLFLYSNI